MPLPRNPQHDPRSGFALLIGLLMLFAAAKPVLYDTLDPDCFWHLRVGQQLLREGVHPLRDTLAFASAPEPWTPYSWLAEIAMVKLWALGGLRAALAVTSLLMAGMIGMVALSCRAALGAAIDDGPGDAVSGGQRWLATLLATAFVAVLSLPYLSFRPVTAAIFLLSVCGWLLLRDRGLGERSRAVWFTVPLTALIANLHLFALLVPLWAGALLLGSTWERVRLFDDADRPEASRSVARYALLTLATAIACLLTPMLPGAVSAAVHYELRDPMVASDVIAEMRPFYAGASGRVSLGLVLLAAACVVRRHRRLRAGELLCAFVGGCLLLKFGRFAPLFALMAAPAVAVTMPKLSDAPLARPALRVGLAMILLLGVGRVIVSFPRHSTDVDAWVNRHGPGVAGYPSEAAAFVDRRVPRETGRIINEFSWGGYLEWRLGDRFQVLLDGRTQVFAPELWRATYLTDEATRRRFLSRVNADAAVVPVKESLFASALRDLGWTVAHRDERAVVLVPPGGGHVASSQGE